MTKKINKKIGVDPETGKDIEQVIILTDSEELIYDLLVRIAEAVKA